MSNARKIQLTAFNGKLVGQPMDWPEEKIGEDIYMVMDMENLSYVTKEISSTKVYETTPRRARFQFSGGYSMKGDMPAIYKLVGVE